MRCIDCHSHTKFSPDSEASVESMCAKAVELGLLAYALTDHCECNTYEEEGYRDSIAASIAAMEEQRSWWKGRTDTLLLTGLELGQPLQNIAAAKEQCAQKVDVRIASVHNITDHPDFYFLHYEDYTKTEAEALLEQYFTEIYETVCWGQFEVLGHLTYPLRYMVGEAGIPVSMKRFDDVIAEIFKELIRQDKALEINTSGLRQKIGQCLPNLPYLKLYADLGGKWVTFGADAHKPEDLGKGIESGMAMAVEAGIQRGVYFKERRMQIFSLS